MSAPGQPPASAPAPGRRMMIAGIVVIAVAIIGGAAGLVYGISRFVEGTEVQQIDGTATVQAEGGTAFSIYRGPDADATGSAEDCRVTGPGGQAVVLESPFATERLTLGGTEYLVSRIFTATQDGPHTVACSRPGFAVGERISVFSLVGVILASVFGGLALLAVGIVLTVIGATRRRRATRQPRSWPPGSTAPSWPPHPGAP